MARRIRHMPKKRPVRPAAALENPFTKYFAKQQGEGGTGAEAAERMKQAAAFEAVFGQPGKRDVYQETVIATLESLAGVKSNGFQFEAGADGLQTALAACHRDGAAMPLRVIARNLERAREARSQA